MSRDTNTSVNVSIRISNLGLSNITKLVTKIWPKLEISVVDNGTYDTIIYIKVIIIYL